MNRKMEFRMERAGLIQVGDHVELKEDTSSTMAGLMYYYSIIPAIAMSNNTKQPLCNKSGIVSKIDSLESYWTVTVDIEEPDEE